MKCVQQSSLPRAAWYSATTLSRESSTITSRDIGVPTIATLLQEEQLKASRVGIAKFLKHYQDTGTIARKPGSGRPSKITAEIKRIVNEQMMRDDETTAHQLHRLLASKGYNISLRTILRCCTSLGWTFSGSAYCQKPNKVKRLQWAIENQGLDFNDVVWTDECTVQLESHRRLCCRRVGQRPRNKPRYVHVYI